MPNALQQAGASAEPSNYAPLHTSRIFTGLWSNRSFLRDAATTEYQERSGMGRQDSILDGFNSEISTRLTLIRRPGSSVYNSASIPPVNRFYSFNTFTATDELIRVLADTGLGGGTIYDITTDLPAPAPIFTKSAGAGKAFFLGVGNTLYFTDGVDNIQWEYGSGVQSAWGVVAPPNAPQVTQTPRPNNYPAWQPNTAYQVNTPAISGMLIVDNLVSVPSNVKIIPTLSGGRVALLAGTNYDSGSAIPLPDPSFDPSRLLAWVTPGNGFNAAALPAGVYQASAPGGVMASSFQNRSGGYAFDASCNWFAVAWDTTAMADVTLSTSGTYQRIVFVTEAGDDLCFQFGSGPDLGAVPVPAGFSGALSLSQSGMVSCDPVNHSMTGVFRCKVDATSGTPTISNLYDDDSGNVWHGQTGVFTAFWKAGQGTSTEVVLNGTALLIPTTGTDTAAMIFAVVPRYAQYGLPTGYTLSNVVACAAMSGHHASPGNRAHGWNCSLDGQTFVGYMLDSAGNIWDATANILAIGAVVTAAGGDIQYSPGTGTTGATEPIWNPVTGGTTVDNTITWTNKGTAAWQAGHAYSIGDVIMGVVVSPPSTPNQFFVATTPGTSGATEPRWQAGVGLDQDDNGVIWECIGRALTWNDLGPGTPITAASAIVDPDGYLENVYSPGVSGTTAPAFGHELGTLTTDNTVVWQNGGPFAVAATAPVQYGYEFMKSSTNDLSNMSPASQTILVKRGNHVIVQGQGTGQLGVDSIVIFRTAQGGSTFLQAVTIPNPGAGQTWTWVDDLSDDDLNTEWQAQVNGEGTPLPPGATCLGYHLGRIFAAVGNVVWVSSGPDAVVGGSSGNAGFNTFLTCQSRITRFWPCPLGMVVFTVRDAYLILGSATDADPLYMVVFIEDIPLRSFDCFTVNKTTPMMLTGNNTLLSLDPSAGITEIGFPIADRLEDEFDSAASFVTFHKETSRETALYVANGVNHWYRMAQTNAPESGSAWSPRAFIGAGIGCVQSVEVTPGQYRLLMSGTTDGPVLYRDKNTHTDNGNAYAVMTRFGAVVLAVPGQLAALNFITLESVKLGTRASLSLLLGELGGTFESLKRTRQDPTNLPPSESLYSDRYHFAQNQKTAWCRHFQMKVEWPAEDVANELLTFTIHGQTWQEMRAQ